MAESRLKDLPGTFERLPDFERRREEQVDRRLRTWDKLLQLDTIAVLFQKSL
jgi:hypothetical protein